MALRKEQVLVLASAVLGLLVWRAGREEPLRPLTLSPGRIEYTAAAVPATPLLTTAPASPVLRAWFAQ